MDITASLKLIEAIGRARTSMKIVEKSKVNTHTKSKYSDINDVLKVVLPALSAEGITLLQPLISLDNTSYFIRTLLVHTATGETLQCDTPVIAANASAQGFGSGITYARRYGLVSLLALEADDDDGSKASEQPQPVQIAPATADEIAQARFSLATALTVEELELIYKSLGKAIQTDRTIIAECQAIKARILQIQHATPQTT